MIVRQDSDSVALLQIYAIGGCSLYLFNGYCEFARSVLWYRLRVWVALDAVSNAFCGSIKLVVLEVVVRELLPSALIGYN